MIMNKYNFDDIHNIDNEFNKLNIDNKNKVENKSNSNKLIKDIDNINKNIKIPKPILKWVGGKTQILDKLIIEFPVIINNYHEIFLGGSSVLLTFLTYIKHNLIKIQGKIYAYDINEPLINLYKNIQSNHIELYNSIEKIINIYNECNGTEINRNTITIEEAKKSKENYYYWIRKQYNQLNTLEKNTLLGSSMFIFLNKTCFRGLFREGPNGFNVPYGNYKNPEIINKIHLEEIHSLIQNVLFECCDFNTSLKNIVENDFVYLDPPYAPEKDTSFIKYTNKGFGLDMHKKLFALCNNLSNENKKFMMSNADVKLVNDHFTDKKYTLNSILCKRTINSKNPESKTKEVIIKNY